MIIEAIWAVIVALLSFVLGLMPDFTAAPATSTFADAYTGISNYTHSVWYLQDWVNVPLLGTAITLIAGAYAVAAVGAVIYWLWRQIPGKAT